MSNAVDSVSGSSVSGSFVDLKASASSAAEKIAPVKSALNFIVARLGSAISRKMSDPGGFMSGVASCSRLASSAIPLLPLAVLAVKKGTQAGINYRHYQSEVNKGACSQVQGKTALVKHLFSSDANPVCKTMDAEQLGEFKQRARLGLYKDLGATACSLASFATLGVGTAVYAISSALFAAFRHPHGSEVANSDRGDQSDVPEPVQEIVSGSATGA